MQNEAKHLTENSEIKGSQGPQSSRSDLEKNGPGWSVAQILGQPDNHEPPVPEGRPNLADFYVLRVAHCALVHCLSKTPDSSSCKPYTSSFFM